MSGASESSAGMRVHPSPADRGRFVREAREVRRDALQPFPAHPGPDALQPFPAHPGPDALQPFPAFPPVREAVARFLLVVDPRHLGQPVGGEGGDGIEGIGLEGDLTGLAA
ncbi:hypothetical protein [Streptomyces sp. NBC_00233]|uniref:hypothetical protein n=1 Tax=Streptomyces sp. NBC_00233 TaxID=2975686 RepID=UPI0022599421|nr:hypothetical protein [Streptomyces sp. NBC_00233]MCX5230190.1 hypothetical protein [Streptomyces sp. NBC_00233]